MIPSQGCPSAMGDSKPCSIGNAGIVTANNK